MLLLRGFLLHNHKYVRFGKIAGALQGFVIFTVFFFTVFATIYFLVGVSQHKDVRQLLLNGCNASWVMTVNYIFDLFGKNQKIGRASCRERV